MDNTRRKILAGIAACAAGTTHIAQAFDLAPDQLYGGSRDTGNRHAKKKSLTKADLEIKYDIAFPRAHFGTSYKERLQLIEKYMQSEGFTDEYYCKGKAISMLEGKIASLFGKQSAMWCPTGTLAQGIATRIHSDNTGSNKLQMHPTSHLFLHENDAYKYAYGLDPILSGEWRQPLNAKHVNKDAACMIVEMPQRHSGGVLPEWKDLEKLKQKARALNVPLHMDGARIWSSRSHYDHRTYAEISDGFSSVYVSFYKDIGACGGAALIGDENFIRAAKVWRTRLGGLVSEHWPAVCDTLRLLDKNILQVEDNVKIARKYASYINENSDYKVYPEKPHSNLFHILLPYPADVAKSVHLEAAKETGIWLTYAFWAYESKESCAMEITINEKAAAAPKEVLENAFSVFLSLLNRYSQKTA